MVVLARPQADLKSSAERLDGELRELVERGQVRVFHNRQVHISATGIRERLAAGEEIPAEALPASVLKYVRKYRLYR